MKLFVTASTPPLPVNPSSFTTTLMVAVPLALATGVKLSVPVDSDDEEANPLIEDYEIQEIT